MIDKECQACYMKVRHSRHDKNRRKNKSSHYTTPIIHIDWDEIQITNKEGFSVMSKYNSSRTINPKGKSEKP